RKETLKFIEKWGVHPNRVAAQGTWVWSAWFHVTDRGTMVVVHVLFLVSILLFTIGFCTRITSVLTWLAVLSYIQRAATTLYGLATMMNILVIYLMIGPSGAALSVDRLIVKGWARIQAFRTRQPPPVLGPTAPLTSATFATRLIQVHLCIIYLAAGLSKLQGSTWWNGTAMWNTLANYEFTPMHLAIYTNGMAFLARHRCLWEVVMTSMNIFTLVVEIGFPFLVWQRRLRWPFVCLAILMHTGIGIFMGLTSFQMMMMAMLLSFVPPETVQRLVRSLPE